MNNRLESQSARMRSEFDRHAAMVAEEELQQRFDEEAKAARRKVAEKLVLPKRRTNKIRRAA